MEGEKAAFEANLSKIKEINERLKMKGRLPKRVFRFFVPERDLWMGNHWTVFCTNSTI